MIYFIPNNPKTLTLLTAGQRLLSDRTKWCKGSMKQGQRYCLNGALLKVGTPYQALPADYISDHPMYYIGRIPRGAIPEPFWFLRQALSKMSKFDNIGRFNDDPDTTHQEVLGLLKSAIELVECEIKQSKQDRLDDRAA